MKHYKSNFWKALGLSFALGSTVFGCRNHQEMASSIIYSYSKQIRVTEGVLDSIGALGYLTEQQKEGWIGHEALLQVAVTENPYYYSSNPYCVSVDFITFRSKKEDPQRWLEVSDGIRGSSIDRKIDDAFVSISSPRAVLMMYAPRFIFANASLPRRW